MTENQEHLSLAEVARIMETTTLSVMMHIKKGLLKGEEIEGVWYVASGSLQEYLQQSGGAAYGELCKSKCGHACGSCGGEDS